jgi:hypothetical protein
MNVAIKKLLPLILLLAIWSCNSTPDHLIYWNENKDEYKQLTKYSTFLFDDLSIKYLNQYRIRTRSLKYIPYVDIKSEYPQNLNELSAIIEKLKKLNADLGIGEGYCSFFIKSGGVFASDEWILFTENTSGYENFKNDISELGYEITYQDTLEKNWYFIVTD